MFTRQHKLSFLHLWSNKANNQKKYVNQLAKRLAAWKIFAQIFKSRFFNMTP